MGVNSIYKVQYKDGNHYNTKLSGGFHLTYIAFNPSKDPVVRVTRRSELIEASLCDVYDAVSQIMDFLYWSLPSTRLPLTTVSTVEYCSSLDVQAQCCHPILLEDLQLMPTSPLVNSFETSMSMATWPWSFKDLSRNLLSLICSTLWNAAKSNPSKPPNYVISLHVHILGVN